jgi:hypothetical protein
MEESEEKSKAPSAGYASLEGGSIALPCYPFGSSAIYYEFQNQKDYDEETNSEENQIDSVGSRSYLGGLPLEAVCLQAANVTDLPAHDSGDPAQCLPEGHLAVLHLGRVIMTRVLVPWVELVLDRLGQPLGE